jgi:hypothetical protein
MAVDFQKACDPAQGFDFKQDEHKTFGYITMLVIGDIEMPADIKVAEAVPTTAIAPPSSSGAEGNSTLDSSGVYTKPVVAVLKSAAWSTLPTDTIKFEGLVSTANMQMISMLKMQSLSKIVMNFSFIVYEYDPVHNKYFASFASHKASSKEPTGAKPKKAAGTGDFKPDANAEAAKIFGLLGKDSAAGAFQIDAKTEISGEAPVGLKVHDFLIHVAPPTATETQQIKIQTSNTNKIIKGFGLPIA